MIKKLSVTSEQVYETIENKEFSEDIKSSSENVVVVMTQDWCPQWIYMKSWLYKLKTQSDVDIYEIIYNKEEYFGKFMRFKETIWKNNSVPYLRYYSNGKFVKDSNYVGKDTIVDILHLSP